MTVSRQQNLFAAEDWKIAYKVYSQIDFQAYDFDTMRAAMVEYIRTNYPENFNDYIESSEFIAIIELLAYLSQSLAFRMDVNTRENFLETAERRDSVYKLARMLGYNPKRNIAASGLMKITSVRTTEPLVDSIGTQLNGVTVYWDDTNNTNSYEQFITILNAAMSKTNRFTAPIKEGTVNNILTELYQLNTPVNSPITYNATINTLGTKRTINIVNPDFKDNSHYFERHPDPTNLFNLIYRNDGTGAGSRNTGFFVMFRQGVLESQDFNFTTPVENRIQNVNVTNINESDVYLQEIQTNGLVNNKWTKIPNTVGQTLNYNSESLNTRNLYAVENMGNDGIRLRFPDGNFGNVPNGIFRLWYRVSDPTRFIIQPEDARNLSITIPYQNAQGRNYALTVNFSLLYSVGNSAPAESIAAIKERAPQVYYTQNRMVSAQDYNIFPQSQSSNIQKIKATNRTHAGHSRYIDINDPTGIYKDVSTFANDCFIYTNKDKTSKQIFINNTSTPAEATASLIPEVLREQALNDFVYYEVHNNWTDPTQPGGSTSNFKYTSAQHVKWNPLPIRDQSKTGYLTEEFIPGSENVLINNVPQTRILKDNSFLKFVDPGNPQDYKWVRVTQVENNGLLSSGLATSVGPWTLSEQITGGWEIREVIISMRKLFTVSEAALIEDEILNRRSFGLGYDLKNDGWYIIPSSDLTSTVKDSDFALDSSGRGAKSWLLLLEYQAVDSNSYAYTVSNRVLQYVVQSQNKIKFYNITDGNFSSSNAPTFQDQIIFTTANTQSSKTENYFWNGSTWQNDDLLIFITPQGREVEIPLRSRDTTYADVKVSWQSNFGILSPTSDTGTNNVDDYAAYNQYVTDAVIPLNSYYAVGGITTETNVVIANNYGKITSLPSKIVIPFSNTTFGENTVDSTGNAFITYRQLPTGVGIGGEVIFKAEVGQTPVSYGADGTTLDPTTEGRLFLLDYNPDTETGNLEYRDIQFNTFHYSKDRSALFSQDQIVIYYDNNKELLTQPINWQVSSSFKEADGYVDPRKVIVLPIDSDGDLVPDRPRQFAEYVEQDDYVLFEYYTDFDGYTYDIPASAVILDVRNENNLVVENSIDRIRPGTNFNYRRISEIDWYIVKNKTVAESLQNTSNASGAKVFVKEENKTYELTPVGTQGEILLFETSDYFVRNGRGKTQDTAALAQTDGTILWNHIAQTDIRIDPSISNIVEMLVLTKSYNTAVQRWLTRPTTSFPVSPTSSELSTEFDHLNEFKAASDTLIFRSAKFKLLFGSQADKNYQARFRVVKLSDQLSDNELKTQIISAINNYFDVDNWEFGETFYFTELSTYIHQQLGSAIGSIVILPLNSNGNFGDLFQVKAEPNELFLSTATVSNIELVSRLDNQTLKIKSSPTVSLTNYSGATNSAGPYAIEGYYPLYANPALAISAGNGTYMEHVFFGQTFYMPNGVQTYHGNYINNSSSSSGSSSY